MNKTFVGLSARYLVIWLFLLGTCGFGVAHAQPAASAWPMFGHDAQHTGRSPYVAAQTPVVKWQIPLIGSDSCPSVGPDGTIYVGSDKGVSAINPDGTSKWNFCPGYCWVNSSPAIGADGTVYVGFIGSLICAIQSDGTQKWAFKAGWDYIGPITLGKDGTIYAGNRDGYLYAVNPDGTLKWKSPVGVVEYNGPALSADGNTVYITSRNGINAVDALSGTVNWVFPTGNIIFKSSPAVGPDGTIYAGSRDCHVYAINPDGTMKWRFQTGYWIESSPAIGVDGTIYVGSGDRFLYALNPDGSMKWRLGRYGCVYSPVIGADGTIYVADGSGYVNAVSDTGQEKWCFNTGCNWYGIITSPAIAQDGTLYIGTYLYTGKFFAIGPGPANHPAVADAGQDIITDSKDQMGTIICGSASDEDGDALTYRWLEEETELQAMRPVDESGKACLDVAVLPYFSIGGHTLTLEVSDGKTTTRDDMVLTIRNSAPVAGAAGGGVYEFGADILLTGDVADFDGDILTYEWIEGEAVLFSGAVDTPFGGDRVPLPGHVVAGGLSLGVHALTLRVSDGVNAPVESSITIEVIDSTAPTLAPIPNITILWPPNHRMADVVIAANAHDDSGCFTLSARVTSNEPEDGLGDGDMSPDWTDPVIDQASGVITLQLRAERSGNGDGRIYSVEITATDCSGNSSRAVVEIVCPHDRRSK